MAIAAAEQTKEISISDTMANGKSTSIDGSSRGSGSLTVDIQSQGIGFLLQNLDRLEHTADKFFDSLAMVGQGPPSLLSAQLVSMSQTCQQMDNDAAAASLLNIPTTAADPNFCEPVTTIPRSDAASLNLELKDTEALDEWVQQTVKETGSLFTERRRLTANIQAALSAPQSKRLDLS
ncbi:hypothetical protein EV177_003647 [Coemansia sp. RSA 1804]|nr:hypothetical protein EV177_003647 [Coemansia sp. RSA 1804]